MLYVKPFQEGNTEAANTRMICGYHGGSSRWWGAGSGVVGITGILGYAVIVTAVELYKARSTSIQRRPHFISPSVHETAC